MDSSYDAWTRSVIREEEIAPFLDGGRCFIDDDRIERTIADARRPEAARIRDILEKSLALKRLDPEEAAALVNVEDPELRQEIGAAAREVKDRVYGPRVVIFAPLYCGNLCVNSCLYCGFRRENREEARRKLSLEEVRRETEALVRLGHKRLVVVYGEHPETDVRYIRDTVDAIYETKCGTGEIRRVNVNAAPLSVADCRVLKDVGIGTYQVFQETYHKAAYAKAHPRGLKANYLWRLYSQHRAQTAGLDDVAIGALFGLADWRFDVLGLLHHAIDLEKHFGGVGPHTISFPRIEPASNAPMSRRIPHPVGDEDFLHAIAVLRLSVPYTGMIVTARESAAIRKRAFDLGCTQTDASSRIGIGSYSETDGGQDAARQQFLLGDTRSLDEMVRELSALGYLTSFCTADYRRGRTGAKFMGIAKKGKIQHLCIPNAILTFKEYLLDYASPETRAVGESLIESRMAAVPESLRGEVRGRLEEIVQGERDLMF